MGLVVLLGILFLVFGLACLIGSLALLKIAKNQGKTFLHVLSIIGLLLGIVMIAAGGLVIFEFIRYVSTL